LHGRVSCVIAGRFGDLSIMAGWWASSDVQTPATGFSHECVIHIVHLLPNHAD